jgi:hypothetical protein
VVKDLQFIEGGNKVVCTELAPNELNLQATPCGQWIYDLSPDERPIEQLSLIAEVLSGRRGAELGAGLPFEKQALQEAWRQIREQHTDDFVVSEKEVLDWHQSEASSSEAAANRGIFLKELWTYTQGEANSEAAANWQRACFHLRWLAQLHPGDQDIARRLAQAEAELSPEHNHLPK